MYRNVEKFYGINQEKNSNRTVVTMTGSDGGEKNPQVICNIMYRWYVIFTGSGNMAIML